MFTRHRRRLTMIGTVEQRRPRALMRSLIALLALMIAWYLVTKVLALFDYSFGTRAPVLLSVRSGNENVQVSLQGAEWQRAETGLKIYPGDAIAIRGSGDAILTFFDGSRIRLDQNSDIFIDQTDHEESGASKLTIKIRSGRIWIATPSLLAYSGSIVRTINTMDYAAKIPPSTQALLGAHSIDILRASGIGLQISMDSLRSGAMLTVGEGQYFSLSEETKKAITKGQDPYDFRDPLSPQLLKDDFLSSSYALLSSERTANALQGSGALESSMTEDLTITSPENHAHITTKTIPVSGYISRRVALILVNGQNVSLRKDGSFSVDMSLSKDTTTSLHIETQDLQGIVLDTKDLTVFNDYKPSVDPVRFKSPVGSGQTLSTSQKEIEITGEAPANTAAILLNDYTLQLFKPGARTWSYLASTALGNLVEGKNTYTVYAVDSDGNKSPARTIFIQFNLATEHAGSGTLTSEPPLKQNAPLSPGTLTVTGPEAGTSTVTTKKEIVLEGTTSGDTSSISINGYTLSLYLAGKTTWNYIASVELQTMKRGRNVYRIVSRNKNGEILDVKEYTINFKP